MPIRRRNTILEQEQHEISSHLMRLNIIFNPEGHEMPVLRVKIMFICSETEWHEMPVLRAKII